MARAGRPKKQIDKNYFEKLCSLQCTLIEIASFFDCSIDTIERFCKREYNANFAEVLNKYASVGKISLRRSQFKLAERSATMAIWLGKQILGQEDKIAIQTIDAKTLDDLEQAVLFNEQDNEGAGDKPIDE
jgi:hypothetical protein